jgi:hypothetical protein
MPCSRSWRSTVPRLGSNLGDLDPAGAVGGSPIAAIAALSFLTRPGSEPSPDRLAARVGL